MKYCLSLALWVSLLVGIGCGGASTTAPSTSPTPPPVVTPSPTPTPTGSAPAPTTTLSAETSNNTSAADSFAAHSDGNPAPGNVSKISIHQLLYKGSLTKVFAHFMAWFGSGSHMNVGYRSDNPAQVHAQLDDMQSRGIDGVVIDWYGQGSYEDNVSLLAKQDIDSRQNFQFALMLDQGTIRMCSGCDPTTVVINALSYIQSTYETSPNYLRVNGKFVVFEFGLEKWPINWTTVEASFPRMLIWSDAVGFTRPMTVGAFAWLRTEIAPGTVGYEGLGYLDGFYQTALSNPAMIPFGSGYKGFNDSLASWGLNRIIYQNCGQTWLDSFAEAGKYYSTSNQIPFLQIVTWNDYEEGTEVETGIDGCNKVTASASGDVVSWSVSGNHKAIAGYTIFGSLDGQNLFKLVDLPASYSSFDVSTASLPSGTYTVYVKMIAQPGILNKMSGPVTIKIQ